jgi:prepilin-type N-terminal cleavage/methylation domain-containing protein
MSSCDASDRKASRARLGRAGFTLIEVLAAVALLGILYSVLARVAIEGLRAEGESERRLEASLLADERVSDLVGRPVLPVGRSQTTEGDFTIAVDVSLFQLPTQWSTAVLEEPKPLLLEAAPGGGMQALRSVQITISWLEAASERHVSRTTYLLDFQSLAALATAAAPGTPPPQNGEEPTLQDLESHSELEAP